MEERSELEPKRRIAAATRLFAHFSQMVFEGLIAEGACAVGVSAILTLMEPKYPERRYGMELFLEHATGCEKCRGVVLEAWQVSFGSVPEEEIKATKEVAPQNRRSLGLIENVLKCES